MINGETIGVGVITYNREELFWKCWDTLEKCGSIIDEVIVVNDGKPYSVVPTFYSAPQTEIFTNGRGVGNAKNTALKYLRGHKCDHIFLIEDDIYIKDPTVFEKYIETSKITGIQHLNFSQHGKMNKAWDDPSCSISSTPNPRVVVDYGKMTLPLYPHCVGAFSYYSKKCLDTVGYIDGRYYNACEHVDHTLEIIKKGMHPPFWYFADIEKSWEYLGDEEWSREKSTISSNPNHQQMMMDADVIFREKHGCVPGEIKLLDIGEVGKQLKEIKK